MKKKSLKSLEEEPLKVFREVFRYHLKAGDPCTDWHSWVPEEFHATIRRRLQSLLDPSTHEPKYTTALAENWQKLDVVVCLDDLINAKSIPNVVGLPMDTALGGMGFADKLLEPQYYETCSLSSTRSTAPTMNKIGRLAASHWSRLWTAALRPWHLGEQ